MKLCTCNNCSNVFEDHNPSHDSIEFPEEIKELFNLNELGYLEDDVQEYFGCPICKTDSYLQDNINRNVGGQAKEIYKYLTKA